MPLDNNTSAFPGTYPSNSSSGLAGKADRALVELWLALKSDKMPTDEALEAIRNTFSGYAERLHYHDLLGGEIVGAFSRDEARDLGVATGSLPLLKVIGLEDRLTFIESQLGVVNTSRPVYTPGTTHNHTGTGVIGTDHTVAAGTWVGGTILDYRYQKKHDGVNYGTAITSTAATYVYQPQAEDSNRRVTWSVSARNANGLGIEQETVAILIGAVATSLWALSVTSAAIDSAVKALGCNGTGSKVYAAQSYITGGGGTITAPSPIGTATVNYYGSGSAAPVANVPAAAIGLTSGVGIIVNIAIDLAAATFTSIGYTLTASGFSQLPRQSIDGTDGQTQYVFYKYETSAVPSTYTFTASSARVMTVQTIALANVNPTNFIEWYAQDSSSSGAATPRSMAVTSSSGTAYSNTVIVYLATADTYGSGLCTAHTPPAGYTELIDSNGAGFGFVPATIAYKVEATATDTTPIGTITGTATLSSGNAGYIASLMAVRGAGGGSGELAASGVLTVRTSTTSTLDAPTTLYDPTAADDWITGMDVTANDEYIVITSASSQYTGPGVTRVFAIVGSDLDMVQAFEGTFDPQTSQAAAAAISGAVTISDGGNTLASVYTGIDGLYTYDGELVGSLYPAPSVTAPSILPVTFPVRGNGAVVDSTGFKLALISSQRINFYTRASRLAVWSPHSTLQPSGSAIVGFNMSNDFTTIAIGTSLGLEIWGGSLETGWSLQQTIAVTGGRTNAGRCVALSSNGGTIFYTEDSATDVSAGSLAAAYAPQKQTFILRIDHA